MSDMHFREPNQVKWQGSRPGHNGTEWHEYEEQIGLGTTVFPAVPGGQRLFLTQMSLDVFTTVSAFAYVYVYTAVPALWRTLFGGIIALGTSEIECFNYWPPLEIPAAYTIRITSAEAALRICLAAHGWVE